MFADLVGASIIMAHSTSTVSLKDCALMYNTVVDSNGVPGSVVLAETPSKVRLQDVQFTANRPENALLQQMTHSMVAEDPPQSFYRDTAIDVTLIHRHIPGPKVTRSGTRSTSSLEDPKAPADGHQSEWMKAVKQVCADNLFVPRSVCMLHIT